MNLFLLVCCLIFIVFGVSSVTKAPPKLQRKNLGGSAKLQWTVTGSFSNYTIRLSSVENGNLSPLPSNAHHSYDSIKGAISLYIWNIQLSNAGYYSLTVDNGSLKEENSTRVLFVYNYFWPYSIGVSGRNPAYEGDTVELGCNVTSTSLPAKFRPRIYYFWYIPYIGYLQNTSSGPAFKVNGDVLSGYSLKNDGKTLVINSVQWPDSRGIFCQVQEEWSLLKYSSSVSLKVYARPYVYSFSQPSRIFNYVPHLVSFSCGTVPTMTSFTNLRFVNVSGNEVDVGKPQVTNYTSQSYIYIPLNRTIASYGNYSMTLYSDNGTTIETFQVVPQGPPEKPSGFGVQYVTHSVISLKWRCMWYNGNEQTVFVRLKDIATGVEVDLTATRLDPNCYDVGYSTLFQTNIDPDTDYKANIFSTNIYGSSDVQTITVRTQGRPTFRVSSENISLTNSEAVITVTTSLYNVTWLNVTCCVEDSALCSQQSYTLLTPVNQIVFDNLPTGDKYVFYFYLFTGDFYTYLYNLASVKDLRASRTSSNDTTRVSIQNDPKTVEAGGKRHNLTVKRPVDMSTTVTTSMPNPSLGNLFIVVIVVSGLLAVAVLSLILCGINIVALKRRQHAPRDNILPVPHMVVQTPSKDERNHLAMNMSAKGRQQTQPSSANDYSLATIGMPSIEEAEQQNEMFYKISL